MKKKGHAALAVALVTSGLASQVAKAGLTGLQNGDFGYDLTNRTPTYTYNNTIAGWYKNTGGPFANYYFANYGTPSGVTWYSQSQVAMSGGSSAYAVLQSDGTNTGGIFQSVGTYTPNFNVSVSLLEGYVSGATGHNLIVSLYSGGKATSTYTTGYGQQWGNSAISGATFLGSATIADNGTNSFNAASFILNTGTTGTTGSTLWLQITNDATDNTQLAVDNIAVSGATISNPLTWTGSSSTTWDSASTNFSNASGGVAFVNGSDVNFNDVAVGKSAITLSGTVMPGTITFNNSSSTYSIGGTGTIAGGTSLTKMGIGSVTLSTSNSFTGPVTINAGSLILQNGAALGTSQAVTVNTGASLVFQTSSGSSASFNNNLYLSGAGSTGQGALVSLSGSNTLVGTVDIGAGQATINVSSGTLAISGSVYGTGGLTKTGAGTLNMLANGKNYFDLNILAGTVISSYYNSLGGTNVNVSTGTTLVLPYSFTDESTNLNINGGTVQAGANQSDAIGYGGPGNQVITVNITSGGVFNIAGTGNEGYTTNWNLTGGSITSTGGGEINVAAGSGSGFTSLASGTTSVISAPIGIRNGMLTFTVAPGTTASGIDLNVTGAIVPAQGGGTLGIDKEGEGTLALTGANSYTGGVTVNAGTLMLGDGTVGHDGSSANNTVILNNDGNLVFDTYSAQSFAGGIFSTGPSNSFAKLGPGTLIYSGAGNFNGTANISAGKMYVNGSISSNIAVTVFGGATLGGTGTVSSPLTVLPGGGIEAGQSHVGTLTVNGLTFNGSAAVAVGTLANYTSSPAIQDNGSLNTASSNSITVTIASLTGAVTGTPYEIFSYSSESGPGAASYTASLPRGAAGSFSDAGNQIDLTLSSLGGAYTLIWTGAGNPANGWDTATTNWNYSAGATMTPTKYIDSPGDPVLFTDAPGSNQTVLINAAQVHPASVTFNNSTYSYTLSGSNGISGATGITLNGTGKVTLNTVNSFTGPVVINAGTLSISSDANLGAVPAAAGDSIFLNGGTLAFSAPVTLNANRTIAINTSIGTIDVGTNTVTIPGVFDGSNTSGGLIVRSTGGGGVLNLTGNQSYTYNHIDGTTGLPVQPTGTLYPIGTLNVSSGTVILGSSSDATGTYAQFGFATIIVGPGATLGTGQTHTFGYFGGFRPNIVINGGTITNTSGQDNYLGQLTLTGGTVTGTGTHDYRLQTTTQSPTVASVTTLPSSTQSVFSIPNLTLYSNTDFNVSKGSVVGGVDLLIASTVGSSGTNGIIKDGAGTIQLSQSNTFTGGVKINAGLIVASQGLASLGNMSGGSFITVNGGELLLKNTSAATVYSMLQTGYNGGAWNASAGITSVAAANDPSFLHAVGMLQPTAATTFEGQPLASGDVAVKYTYYGDTNLDGKVDGSDYSRVDFAYLENQISPGTLTGWQNGDFNYDGVVNGSDYTLLDNAFNTQGALIAAEVATPNALIAGSGTAAVPEPATLGLLGIGAIGLLGRRRRRSATLFC